MSQHDDDALISGSGAPPDHCRDSTLPESSREHIAEATGAQEQPEGPDYAGLRDDLEILLQDGSVCLVAKRPKEEETSTERRNVFCRKFTSADAALAHLRASEVTDTAGELNYYVVRNPSGPEVTVWNKERTERVPARGDRAGNPPSRPS